MEQTEDQKVLENAAEATTWTEPQEGIQLARSQFLDELPGLAFAVITLVWIVASLIPWTPMVNRLETAWSGGARGLDLGKAAASVTPPRIISWRKVCSTVIYERNPVPKNQASKENRVMETFVEQRVGLTHRRGVTVVLAFAALGLGFASSPALCAPALFKESWVDKAKCQNLGGGDIQCEEISDGKSAVSATIMPSEPGASGTLDSSQLDPTTRFDITIGNFSYSGTLGEDPKYAAGKDKVTLPLTGEVCDADGNCKENVEHGHILLSMTKKGLKVSISTLTGADALGNAYETPIVANEFDGQPTGSVTDNPSCQSGPG